ncbi:Peptidase S53 propeptide (plasmid) [Streptantibioticus cattleyicolor NRRL 8057 = DSM 46488]|uniref:Peptidase S53 propeptide n=1 Tax=Streptantibioticus cattleyicolor (strain ATCC 35852 / DSM 46488 / JCM 4925 / NBRC 14057 / NRRL 8057) TaxID=1003195 RepID=G8XGJ6_STREN|nr:Peptidase S53 propeptide [Streptantibioticus cattleyicolor NRRL 8057 = DSM 46488]
MLAAGAVVGVPGTGQAAATAVVPGSVPSAVRAASVAGAVPASRELTVQVWLKPDLAGAAAFADAVATPGGPEFHHYLSPDAYTARFGPSAAHATALAAWLRSRHLTQVRIGSGRDYVSATGPVSAVQSAFGVRINQYRTTAADGTPTVIRSNDRDVSLPAALASDVIGVTGLNDVPPAVPRAAAPLPHGKAANAPTCSHYWAQHVRSFRPAYQGLTKASLPACGYSAAQIRAAYGATWTDTGKGQTVALTEDEAPEAMFRTLTEYARTNHLPAPKPSQFREIQGGKPCAAPSHHAAHAAPVNDEAEMDAEAVYAMAPDANQLMVVGQGCDENQALLNAALTVLTGDGRHPSASIVSNSWQIPLGSVPERTVHAIALRAASEGVGMYFSSGDTSGLTVTDSDPYVTAVGGTTLGIGAAGNRVFETGWSSDYVSLDHGKWSSLGLSAAGGGTSLVHGQPAYQKGVVPASMSHVRVGKRTVIGRAVPDIAADADPDTGLLTGYTASDSNGKPGPYRTVPNAGTSLACPLVAGLIADAQQGRTSPFGFINPLLYRLAGTPAFHDVLPVTPATPQQNRAAYLPPTNPSDSPALDVFDSQRHPDTNQVTAKGYDTMTGLGTPNGTAFLTALRRGPHAVPGAGVDGVAAARRRVTARPAPSGS